MGDVLRWTILCQIWLLYLQPFWFYRLKYVFAFFWLCDLDLWPFNLVFIGGRGIVMDSPCAKFGDFGLSRFGFYRADNRQILRQNHRCGWSLYWRRLSSVNNLWENYLKFGATFVCIVVMCSYARKCLYALCFKLTTHMWLLLTYCLAASASILGSTASVLASFSKATASASSSNPGLHYLSCPPNKLLGDMSPRWFRLRSLWSKECMVLPSVE